MGRIDNRESGCGRCSITQNSSSRQKKYLSLTKDEVKREGSLQGNCQVEKKGIGLSLNKEPKKSRASEIVNFSRYNEGNGRNPNSSVVRPSDLPKWSSQKIIPAPPMIHPESQKMIRTGRNTHIEPF